MYDVEMIQKIEEAYEDPSKRSLVSVVEAVRDAVDLLDQGVLRVAEKNDQGVWEVCAWAKKAILLYFGTESMAMTEVGPFVHHDKIPLKSKERLGNVRIVPGAMARYGSFLEAGVIMMPSYVNIGARVGAGTMVDTWATVGSCAQVGKNVHLSGGVGIGGVLEPPQGAPVIIEDDVFVGSRAIVVEGVRVEKGAVLGANVVLTKSTKIIDVSGDEPVEHKGVVPENSVVIPGVRMKQFSAGTFGVPSALIIGQRTASTDTKTSLNQALRDFEVSV